MEVQADSIQPAKGDPCSTTRLPGKGDLSEGQASRLVAAMARHPSQPPREQPSRAVTLHVGEPPRPVRKKSRYLAVPSVRDSRSQRDLEYCCSWCYRRTGKVG